MAARQPFRQSQRQGFGRAQNGEAVQTGPNPFGWALFQPNFALAVGQTQQPNGLAAAFQFACFDGKSQRIALLRRRTQLVDWAH